MSNIDKDGWEYVFVYGTLKRGGYFNGVFVNKLSEFIGEATLNKAYSLYVPTKKSLITYPVMVQQHGKYRSHGELYLVDPLVMMQLDIIEGAPQLYKREKVIVTMNKTRMTAQTYIYNHDVPKDMVHRLAYEVGKYGD